jgi:hypothetical protein
LIPSKRLGLNLCGEPFTGSWMMEANSNIHPNWPGERSNLLPRIVGAR